MYVNNFKTTKKRLKRCLPLIMKDGTADTMYKRGDLLTRQEKIGKVFRYE